MNTQNTAVFVTGLRNAHALEMEAAQATERQLDRLADYPQVAERLRRHLEETRQQQARLESILEGLDTSPSTVKETVMGLMGNAAALAHTPANDEILKNTLANLALENYEIAAYRSLITMAETLNHQSSLPLLRQTLEEERSMAQWIDENIPAITRQFMTLRESGRKADR